MVQSSVVSLLSIEDADGSRRQEIRSQGWRQWVDVQAQVDSQEARDPDEEIAEGRFLNVRGEEEV
jgi:hypothetical protein